MWCYHHNHANYAQIYSFILSLFQVLISHIHMMDRHFQLGIWLVTQSPHIKAILPFLIIPSLPLRFFPLIFVQGQLKSHHLSEALSVTFHPTNKYL
jgi:hypothetical protein